MRFKVKILVLVLTILVFISINVPKGHNLNTNTVFGTSNTYELTEATNTSLYPNMVFINKTFYDSVNDGLFTLISNTGSVLDNSKLIVDYISAVNYIINQVKYTNNQSYLNYVGYYLSLINRFNTSNGGFKSHKNADWTNNTLNNLNSADISFLLSMYANLYNITKNAIYLRSAINIYNFIENHFYDSLHGGYFYYINPDTFQNVLGYRRSSSVYASMAGSFADLYENTNNKTYLVKGFELLNETINLTYNKTLKFFYPYLFEDTNLPDTSFTTYATYQQLSIALNLLRYSNITALKQYKTDETQFYNLNSIIINNILENLTTNQNMVIYGYDVKTNVQNTVVDAAVQNVVYNYLIELKGINNTLTSKESLILNQGNTNLNSFFNPHLNLYFRAMSNNVSSPWLNYDILSSLTKLNNFLVPQSNTTQNKSLSNSRVIILSQNTQKIQSNDLIIQQNVLYVLDQSIIYSILVVTPILGVYVSKKKRKKTKLNTQTEYREQGQENEKISPMLVVIGSILAIIATVYYSTKYRNLDYFQIKENPIRSTIIQILEDEHFIHFNKLKQILNCGVGNLKWHIQVLQEFKIVDWTKIGQFKVLYLISNIPLQEEVNLFYTLSNKKIISIFKLFLEQNTWTLDEIKFVSLLRKDVIQNYLKKLVDINILNENAKSNKFKLNNKSNLDIKQLLKKREKFYEHIENYTNLRSS